MTINLQCPACEKQLRVKDELAGKRLRCPCGQTFSVPAQHPSPSSKRSQQAYQARSKEHSGKTRPTTARREDNSPSQQEKELFLKQLDALKEVCAQYSAMRESVFSAFNEASITESLKEMERGKQRLQELSTLDLVMRNGLIALGAKFLPVWVGGIEFEHQAGKDGNPRFLCAMINIVEELGQPAAEAIPILITVLNSNSGLPSEFAAGALGAIGGQEAVEALTFVRDKMRTTKEPYLLFFSRPKTEHEYPDSLRKAAVEALSKVDPR